MAKLKKEQIILRQGEDEININYDNLRSAVLVLRAINHELRRQIISLLEDEDRMTVTQIYIKLRIEQSVASQHLAILRKAGIVIPSREGKFIYYGLEKERLSQISQLVSDLSDQP
jgi:DNA-binding transcriptional ArsR family regulator